MFDLAVWLPGIVFVGLAVWLLRKIVKAARTEGDLESDRLEGAFAEELKAARARARGEKENEKEKEKEPELAPDLGGVDPAHLAIIEALVAERDAQARASHSGPADVLRRVELVWARSNATHAVWCERRHAATRAASAMTRDVVCVAQIEKGNVVERWYFG